MASPHRTLYLMTLSNPTSEDYESLHRIAKGLVSNVDMIMVAPEGMIMAVKDRLGAPILIQAPEGHFHVKDRHTDELPQNLLKPVLEFGAIGMNDFISLMARANGPEAKTYVLVGDDDPLAKQTFLQRVRQ